MKLTIPNFILATVMFAISAALTLTGQVRKDNPKPIYYSAQNLGTLGGVFGSSAHSINDQGAIAGVANLTGDTEEHAALWQEGVVTDLGTLGGDNSNVDFPVKNDSGLIVGFAQTPVIDPLGENFCVFLCTLSGGPCNGSGQSCRGFRRRDGILEPLGTLGGNNSVATGANNRGVVVGAAENAAHDPNCISPQVLDYEAVAWRGQTIRELPPLPGDGIGVALAVNDYEEMVGTTGSCGSGPGMGPVPVHAVLWTNDSPTDLGNLGGLFNNVAYAINNADEIVGASDLASDNTGHAFLWKKGVMTDLGTLPGDFSSAAFDINDRGQIAGQSCDVNFNCRAFVWQNGVMTDLNTLVSGCPLYLTVAASINTRGEIVGTGLDQNADEPVAFAAVPCEEKYAAVQGCQTSGQNASNMMQITSGQGKTNLPKNIREMLQRQKSQRGLRLGQ